MMLPAELPRRIRRQALCPPGLPDGEFGWTKESALVVLGALAGSIVAVFQVDVYVRVMPLYGHHEVVHAGRRATWVHIPGELALQFAHRSRQAAAAFVQESGEDDLFVLHLSGQDDAESGHGIAKLRAG